MAKWGERLSLQTQKRPPVACRYVCRSYLLTSGFFSVSSRTQVRATLQDVGLCQLSHVNKSYGKTSNRLLPGFAFLLSEIRQHFPSQRTTQRQRLTHARPRRQFVARSIFDEQGQQPALRRLYENQARDRRGILLSKHLSVSAETASRQPACLLPLARFIPEVVRRRPFLRQWPHSSLHSFILFLPVSFLSVTP